MMLAASSSTDLILGSSREIREALEDADRAIAARLPVLVFGEIGTGKSYIAQLLHSRSGAKGGPFIRIHSADLGPHALEVALKNAIAITSAQRTFPQHATFFFREVADMPEASQQQLASRLAFGSTLQLGQKRFANIQVLCSSTVDLRAEVDAGRFRTDLYRRLRAVVITPLPLRSRIEDVPDLANYFVELHAAQHHRPRVALSANLTGHLLGHTWPGNLLELSGLMLRLVILRNEQSVIAELDQCGGSLTRPMKLLA